MDKITLPDQPSLFLLSLGCPKNRVDSEVMLGSLLNEGYRLVEEAKDAEVILINSCAFIGEAKQESIDAILEHARLKENGRCKALVVAGCLTQRYAEVLQQEMPEVDYFVGTSAYPRIAQILRGERDRAVIPDPDYIADSRTPRRNSMPRWTAYVKISEGCDNKCTFCIIPTLRGLQRSRPIADIVAEAERFCAEGAVETDYQFLQMCEYVQETGFENEGDVQFSREEGTESCQHAVKLDQRVKAQRKKQLHGVQRKISRDHQQRLVGRTLDVLIEGVSEETDLLLEGRWMGQAPEIDGKVYVNRGQARPGEIMRVEIEQAGDYDLVGGIAGADGSPVAVAAPKVPRPRFPILSH